MEKNKQKVFQFVGLAIAMALLVNMARVLPVSAAEARSIFTVYPVVSSSDSRVSVTLCATYQESLNIYTGASVHTVSAMSGVKDLSVGVPYLSSDQKTIYVQISYRLNVNGEYVYKSEVLSKSCG